MKNYLVIISWYHPYPKSSEYRMVGSSHAVAISRAFREWRKENPRIKVKEINCKAIKI